MSTTSPTALEAPPTPMRVADYIARTLAQAGIRKVFMMTGGGAMHLNDALGFHEGLDPIFIHHEQAASIAAEGYARVTGTIGAVNVTTGPGGINAINGVFGAWTDSIPMIVVSGQVRRDTILGLKQIPGLRQLGDQEVDIVSMVRGITKYAAMVEKPEDVRYHIERALYEAIHDRPGPVWIDVPIDVQGSRIVPEDLRGFEPSALGHENLKTHLADSCARVVARLKDAKRPVLLVGTGVRLSPDGLRKFRAAVERMGIPVTTAWTAIDVIESDHHLFAGRPGTIGDRAGNFAVQNADLLISVGSRLPIRQTSYNWNSFARAAFKVLVDIDPSELAKPMVVPDLAITADAGEFFDELVRQLDQAAFDHEAHRDWVAWCLERRARYPILQDRQKVVTNTRINPYYFIDVLTSKLQENEIVVCGNATASVVTFQTAKIKRGQRYFANAGCASMGYDLPASIGAAVAAGGQRVICLAGDGSLQLNIQELQTVKHHNLPIKIFVLNNDGYLSMRLTQGSFFKRFVGESSRSGVSFPDVVRVAEAYGIPAYRAEGDDFAKTIDTVLATEGPVVCDAMLDPEQAYEPKLSSRQLEDGTIVSAALEDMAPFLSKEELAENMLLPS